MKKLICYSLYGDNIKYCMGMLENLIINKVKLPEWQTYIYYYNVPSYYLSLYKDFTVKLIECDYTEYKWEGMLWRFSLLNDNNIDIFLSRDADSRITNREINLINKFIESKYCFHIIRDHSGHGTEILGGTFGVKVKEFNNYYKIKNIKEYILELYKNYHKNMERNVDQYFLRDYIWTLIKDNHLAHISHECVRYHSNDIKIKNDINFIGSDINIKQYNVMIIGNYTDPEYSQYIFKHMMTYKNQFYNLNIVSKGKVDYYIILNYPKENSQYIKSKSLIFYLEPSIITNTYGDFSPKNINKNDYYYYHNNHKAIEWHITYDYNYLINSLDNDYFYNKKTKNISSIVTSNYNLIGHKLRLEFLKYLNNKIDIDVYGKIFDGDKELNGGIILKNLNNYKGEIPGHGTACHSKKELGLEDYKYHIAIENSFENNYWTEKIVDPILCECLTFYDGCLNLNEILHPESYIKINLNDFESSYKIIIDSIKNKEWEKRIDFIRESKKRILNNWSFLHIAFKRINNEHYDY
jgi:hypothetical protein